MNKLLKKYGYLINDWDVDKDEYQGDCYFVYLKRPYVYNDCGQITDMLSGELNIIEEKIKSVYQDEKAWDSL